MEENGNNPDSKENQPKKKRNRSTKKSVAAENEKKQKCLKTLLNCDSLPPYVAEFLKKEEEDKGQLYKVSPADVEKLWGELHMFVREDVAELLADDCASDEKWEVISCVVSMLEYMVFFHSVVESESFTQMAVVLNLAMTHNNMRNEELKHKICKLSEYCCIHELRLPGEFYLDTFNFLFDLTLKEDETDKKGVIKRMWEMRVPLSRVNLRTASCEGLVSKLASAVVSPAYLACKDGRQFIAFAFTLDLKLIKKFHQAVKDFLPRCKRNQAVAYGEVYFGAWVNSSAEIRQALETQCIQNLMTHMFTFPRKRQELTHLGQNVFAILAFLHDHRTIPHFSKTLTELYMPLLWRHLRSGNNIERCNAAEVFLDVYPLEKPGSGKAEESTFLDKQHSEMADLLTDNCHVVRIIAIKGICARLCSAWSTFPQETVQVLMRNLLSLTNDGSTSIVRRSIYDGLSIMLRKPETAAYLSRILPSLRDYLHDENEKVRRAFVNMLCVVKGLPDPAPIKYWKITPINHLAARLEIEGAEVGSALAKLLISNIYSSEHSADRFMFRLMKFIETSSVAARKLFQFSLKALDYKSAVRVMLTILLNLRAQVKRKEAELSKSQEEEQKENQEMPLVTLRKKRRSTEPMKPITENEQNIPDNEDKENDRHSDNRSSSGNESVADNRKNQDVHDYCRPEVAHTLIDIVSLLWTLHSQTLIEPENEEDHNNLLDIASASIPLFLKHYKGGHTYYAAVHLASLVPMAKLTPVSTVCSASVSHLKQVCEVTPQAEIDVIVHALCAWNRFAEIQDLVMDWLDQGFRCEMLNQSKVPDKGVRQRKVRFVAKGGKPMLALRLLDAVFSVPVNSRRVMEKSYNQVHELYEYLGRIKRLVESRLINGLPFESPMLSDEFLIKCMYRYTKLILILHRPEPQTAHDNETIVNPFDASEEFRLFLKWTTMVIIPMIPTQLEDEPDTVVLLMNDILRAAANLIDIDCVTEVTVIRLAEQIRGLLSSECPIWYVEASMMVIKHLKDYSEAHFGPEDKAHIMSTVVPSLLSQCLRSLSDGRYTKEDMARYFKNVQELKTVMLEVLLCLRRLFGSRSKLQTTMLQLFTDSMVNSINHDVKQLQVLAPVEKVAELPYVCCLLLSVVTKPSVVSEWLATIPSSIRQLYSTDANVLGAAVCLLYTLVRSGLPLDRDSLCTALQEAYTTVQQSTRESTQTAANMSTSDSISTTVEYIDVKMAALPILKDLAEVLHYPLP